MDDFSGVADLVPEGAVPLHSLRIVEYTQADGTSDFHFKVDGDVLLSTTIGMLDLVKHAYLHESFEDL